MQLIGLKFLLTHGAFVTAVMTTSEAQQIVSQWQSCYYKVKDIQIIGSVTPPPGYWAWAVKVSEIQAVHTFDLAALQQTAHQPPLGSGLRVNKDFDLFGPGGMRS